MDLSKVNAAIAEAQTQLNNVTDEEFKARRITSLRPLTLAANALELAAKHLATAAERSAPKAATTTEAPAADAKAAKKATPAK